MSGYIGTKAVTLSTTSATVGGDSTVGGDLTVDTNTLYVDSTNNRVGIGTSSTANGKLVVENNGSNLYLKQTTGDYGHVIGQNDADGALTFSRRDGGNTERLRIDASGALNGPPSANFVIKTGSGTGDMQFFTNGTQRVTIDSSGNISMGSFNASGGSVGVLFDIGGGTSETEIQTSVNGTATRTHYKFINDNGAVGTITTNGSSTAYNTSSDYRLKENVTNVTDGITRVKQLEPKRFNFIADPDRTVDGFLAHEAQAVVPEAVTGTHNEVDDDGNAVMQGIDQSKLVPLLTAALKEAITKIETLETEMTSVKARLDALEGN